jgi:hypothetical protein
MNSLNEGIRIPQHMLREIKMREPPRQWDCDDSVYLNSDANQIQRGRVAGQTAGTGLGQEGNEMVGEIAALILQKADSKEGFDGFANAIVDRMQNLVVYQGPSSNSTGANLWAPHCRATNGTMLDPAHASSCRDYLSKVLEDLNNYDDKQPANTPSHSFAAMPMSIEKLGISVPHIHENESDDTNIPVGAMRKPAQSNQKRDGYRLVQGHAIHSIHDHPPSAKLYDTASSEDMDFTHSCDAADDTGAAARSNFRTDNDNRPPTQGKESRAGTAPERRKIICSKTEEHRDTIVEGMISRPLEHSDRQASSQSVTTLASNMHDASCRTVPVTRKQNEMPSADSEGMLSAAGSGSTRCTVHVQQGAADGGHDTPTQPTDKTNHGSVISEPATHSVPTVQGSKLNPSNTTLVERGPSSQHALVRRAQLPTEHSHETATHSETICTTSQHAASIEKDLERENTEHQPEQLPNLGIEHQPEQLPNLGIREDTAQVVRQEPRRPGPACINVSQVASNPSKQKQQKKRGKEPSPADFHVPSDEVKGVIVNQEAVARKGHLPETAAAMSKICKKLASK